MSKLFVGTVQTMNTIGTTDHGYVLYHPDGEVLCPNENTEHDLEINQQVDVFIYLNEHGQSVATTHIPTVTLNTYGWGEMKSGTMIDIGAGIDVSVPESDLPAFQSVWPIAGDKVYVLLKKDRQDRLFAVPAKERVFEDLFVFADDVELNDRVGGHVIRPGKEGTVMLTDDHYRAFIHHTEREKEPRLGEYVTGRVIEVKEDGTLNVSLRPLKHERMADDAEKILAYLEANGGEMPFGNKTDAEVIQNTFGMSKSAFKRALGRLLKERRIGFQEGKTVMR